MRPPGSFQAITPWPLFQRQHIDQSMGRRNGAFHLPKPSGDKEAGAYVILKNDGTSEQGGWDADNLRKDFSLNP